MKTKQRELLFIHVVDFPQDGKPACRNYHNGGIVYLSSFKNVWALSNGGQSFPWPIYQGSKTNPLN